jgi:hypothetical protein
MFLRKATEELDKALKNGEKERALDIIDDIIQELYWFQTILEYH